MKRWTESVVEITATIEEAMQVLNRASLQCVLVLGEDGRLAGVVTDGDVRRGILAGIGIRESVRRVMNEKFTAVTLGTSREEILRLMKRSDLRQIPVLDNEGRVAGLQLLQDMLELPAVENRVIIMAGGKGVRLRPVTETCPKPLLKVGAKPLLEIILESFISYGFQRFTFSVNYKAEMITDYFGDGSRWGASIDYLHEDKFLGTAGALSLLPETPGEPFIVMNGDVLTKVNLLHLLEFHRAMRSDASMCVREYQFQVPYGVVRTDQHRLLGIDEKPLYNFFVNGGIYVLSPSALDFIPRGEYFDMPSLFQRLIENGRETTAFPIKEYWIDIGHMDDFARANAEYLEIFSAGCE